MYLFTKLSTFIFGPLLFSVHFMNFIIKYLNPK